MAWVIWVTSSSERPLFNRVIMRSIRFTWGSSGSRQGQRAGVLFVVTGAVEIDVVDPRGGHIGARGPQHLLPGHQRAQIQRLRLLVVALGHIESAEVVQRDGDIWMDGPQRLLQEPQR